MSDSKSRTILVVAAHTDDEALGCGGTIARHVSEGDRVHAVFMADGVTSRAGAKPRDVERRMAAAKRAHEILGLRGVTYLGLPDNRLDSVDLLDVVQGLEGVIQKVRPEVIYTHHCGDLNIDHRITHDAVLTACRPLPGGSVKEIYAFEVMSSTEWGAPERGFMPNAFVDIGDYMDVKQKVLEAYGLEMRQPPHSRSIRHVMLLAQHRGHSVGVMAAEAFVAVRILK